MVEFPGLTIYHTDWKWRRVREQVSFYADIHTRFLNFGMTKRNDYSLYNVTFSQQLAREQA